MEFLDGESLRARMKRERPLPLDLALSLANQIATAVEAAHAAGVIHRDLKPDNLFLVPDADAPHGIRAKVLDFGLAKVTGGNDPRLTKTGNFVGTPLYMSPEQCRLKADVDHRTDIYSLGCILFEMVCGRPPFVDKAVGDLVIAHNSMPPPSPSELSPNVTPALERLLLRSLAKHPEDRPKSMADFASVLTQLAAKKAASASAKPAPSPGVADTAVARPPKPSNPPPMTDNAPAAVLPPPAPSRMPIIGLVTALAIAIVVIAILLAR
jgi:serine/threonine-protein kinase